MTEHENYQEPGDFGEGATVRRAEPPMAWAYEYHDFGDVWTRHVILNNPDGTANPPTKHDGSTVRNVRPLFASSRAVADNAQEATLRKIAAYDDAAANAYLRATGSYRCFDEAHAVELARAVLEGAETPSPSTHLIGWQDISTAPKDGCDLLLTSHDWNGDAVVGSFAFGEWREDASPSGRTLAPTYWMSIPPLSNSSVLESDELSEINAALKTIQSTCLQLQYDHSGRYGAETIEPLRDVARLINKLVWKQAHTPSPQPREVGE